MKSVLVTGATGGLGRNAVTSLLQQGVEVRATGRNQKILAELKAQGATVCHADLVSSTSRELESLVQGCDTVWHCAAVAAPWGAYSDFFQTNVVASGRLYFAAMRAECKNFIAISSPSIYFDYTARTNIHETFRPKKFVNHYAQTKFRAELALNAMAERYSPSESPRLVHLRPRAIFGPYDQVLFPRLMALVADRKGLLPLPNGGEAVLDLTYVENVLHAMTLASTAPVPSGSVFNITNGEPVVLRETLAELFGALGTDVRFKSIPYRALDVAARAAETISLVTRKEPSITRYGIGALAFDMTLDITRARQQLGYAPKVRMADAIALTADWIKRHG